MPAQPPVSPRIRIRVSPEDFDVGRELELLTQEAPSVGAVASFVGRVRDAGEGVNGVQALTLEHYPGMTELALQEIAQSACQRWQCDGITIIHRVGRLQLGEQIVLVAVASRHRGDAFAACEFIMDFLKTRAPLWKQEETPAGKQWVAARASDAAAAARWVEGEAAPSR